MELYTLDGLLRRTELVEGYESFIWTERQQDNGDIQIIMASTTQNRNLLPAGTLLGLSESERVMKIETVSDAEADDGSKKIELTGKEVTDVTNDRTTLSYPKKGTQPNTWSETGKAHEIMGALFDYACRSGSALPVDAIPLLEVGSLHAAGNIPFDDTIYTIERPYGPLYDVMKELADIFDLGFRLYKGLDTSKLYFDVYKGNDRTSSQTVLPPVIFSEDLDSLQSVSELTSVAKSKNVAVVVGIDRNVTVYGDGASDTTTGFGRRVLYVSATDIQYADRTNTLSTVQETAINKAIALPAALDPQKDAMKKLIDKKRFATGEAALITAFTTAQVTAGGLVAADKTNIDAAVTASSALEAAESAAMDAALAQKGTQELAKNRSISAFDGKITQLSPYKYRRDYDLGDLVEMRNSTGLTNQMLVTEQIFTADESGESAYPTLTIKRFITPGSWLAWENSQVWQDAPGVWSTS